MREAIRSERIGPFTVSIYYDDCTESPRMWETDSVFFGFHRRYASPDKPPSTDPDEARKIAEDSDNICLPVWLYDHSGTCYRAAESNPFNCPWDSGLFGFIYIPKAAARARYGVKRLNAATVERVKEGLKAAVDEYSAWANGETYFWEITDESGNVLDSCGGYIGSMEYALSDARERAGEIQAA